jgi:FG-GAP-like repeat
MILKKPRAVHALMSFAVALVLCLPIAGVAQTRDFADPSASSVAKRMLPRGGSSDRSDHATTDAAGRKARSFAEMLAAVSASTPSQKLPRFVAHRDYLAADGPQNIAMGDLNGDGIADLIVNDGNTSNISLLLGNRNGTFQPLKLINAGGKFPFDVAIADLNGDGKNDVAITTISGVFILLGDGKGNLGAPRFFAAGTNPGHIVLADFNGDHKLDLAVTNIGSNDVSILLGKGDGTFAAAESVPVGMGPLGIAVGDFNHDGKPDLAVVNTGIVSGNNKGPHGNTLAILLGNGKGGFRPASFIPVEKRPLIVVASDFNNDKNLDLAVSNNGTGDVSELLGNGDGTFRAPRLFHVKGAASLSVADFDGDGNQDLAVTNLTATLGAGSDIAILFGDGKGNFKPPVTAPSGRTALGIFAGDFNHDGKTDYITADSDSNSVSVVLGNGDGTFFDIGAGVNSKAQFSLQMVTADFNHDGLPDLALVNTGSNPFGSTVSVMLGKQGGGFMPGKLFAVDQQPTGLAVTDFNHDGHLDLVVANFGNFPTNGDVSLLLGNGDGTFQSPRNFTAGDFPASIAVADFNRDGNPDAVVANFGTTVGTPSISVMFGDGNNKFGKSKNIVSFPNNTQLSHVTTGDFNGDGKADIAYINVLNDNRVSIQLGNGDGTFQPPQAVIVGNVFTTIFFTYSVGDFNNDGIPDFAVEIGGEVEILLGDGKGSFTSTGVFSEGEGGLFFNPDNVLLADFNGDGFLDVAVTDGFDDNVSLLLGNGDGTLGTAHLFAGGFANGAVVIDSGNARPGIAISEQVSFTRAEVVVIKNDTLQK